MIKLYQIYYYPSLNWPTKLLETGTIVSQSDKVSKRPCALPLVETMASWFTKKERWHLTIQLSLVSFKVCFSVDLSTLELYFP